MIATINDSPTSDQITSFKNSSVDYHDFTTCAKNSWSLWALISSPDTQLNNWWGPMTSATPDREKKLDTFLQSLRRNSSPCGWEGSTDWLTSMKCTFPWCHSMLYSLRSACIRWHIEYMRCIPCVGQMHKKPASRFISLEEAQMDMFHDTACTDDNRTNPTNWIHSLISRPIYATLHLCAQ